MMKKILNQIADFDDSIFRIEGEMLNLELKLKELKEDRAELLKDAWVEYGSAICDKCKNESCLFCRDCIFFTL